MLYDILKIKNILSKYLGVKSYIVRKNKNDFYHNFLETFYICLKVAIRILF